MAANKSNNEQLSNDEIFTKFLEGTKLAIARLIERKKKEDGYLVISQNGKVVKVKAADIKISK